MVCSGAPSNGRRGGFRLRAFAGRRCGEKSSSSTHSRSWCGLATVCLGPVRSGVARTGACLAGVCDSGGSGPDDSCYTWMSMGREAVPDAHRSSRSTTPRVNAVVAGRPPDTCFRRTPVEECCIIGFCGDASGRVPARVRDRRTLPIRPEDADLPAVSPARARWSSWVIQCRPTDDQPRDTGLAPNCCESEIRQHIDRSLSDGPANNGTDGLAPPGARSCERSSTPSC